MSTRTRWPLHTRMLVGFLVGLVAGLAAHVGVEAVTKYLTGPIGQVFLRLLFMLVLPLLFSALVVGVAGMGDIRALGRVGWKTLAYTIVMSTIAVVLGIVLVNVFEPGRGVDPAVAQGLLAEASDRASAIVSSAASQREGIDFVLGIIPENVFRAAADNDILAVMFFALFFGIGLLLTSSPRTEGLKRVFEGVFEVSMKLIGLVIQLAPIAVFCFMFNLAAQFGWDLLVKLAAFVAVVLLALGLQMFGVFPLLLAFLARKNPITFFKETREASVMAFSTSSSNASLPTALSSSAWRKFSTICCAVRIRADDYGLDSLGHTLPAIPYSRIDQRFLRQEVAYQTAEAPGTNSATA